MKYSLKFIALFLIIYLVINCSHKNNNKTEKEKIKLSDISSKKIITKDYIIGKFDPNQHVDFIKIDSNYTDKINVVLRKKTYRSFLQMAKAAQRDGINLIIRSATRNFESQKNIWERKWKGETLLEGKINAATEIKVDSDRAKAILRYSSMPGTSRHHWGTDIDLNNFENSYFESGQGLRIYTWLRQNAATFGFCQVYTEKDKDRPTGYEEEKWHWTYMPISYDLTIWAKENLQSSDISGFLGAETAEQLNVIEHYVLGINKDCLTEK